MDDNLVRLLHLNRSPKQKKALLEPLLVSYPELVDILRLSQYFNWSSFKVEKSFSNLLIVDGEMSVTDASTLLRSVTAGDVPRQIVSKSTKHLAAAVLSPSVMGLSSATISTLLAGVSGNLVSAKERFNLPNEVLDIKECPICTRQMKSVTEGRACLNCENLVKSFTYCRRGPFVIPINKWNFPNFSNVINDKDFEMTFLDYKIHKVTDRLLAEHVSFEGESPIHFPLPWVEFQKTIVN